MTKWISQTLLPLLVLVVTLLTVGAGCANNKNAKAKTTNAGVTDINVGPVPPRESETAYVGPLNGAPSYYQAPAVTQTPTAAAPASSSAAGGSYVVKKGDTLFSIAKANYGSGNQWQKIAAANPGLSPATLKAGQKIVLP